MSVRLPASIDTATIGRISVKFGIGKLMKIRREIPKLVKSDKNIGHFTPRLYYFFPAGAVNLPFEPKISAGERTQAAHMLRS